MFGKRSWAKDLYLHLRDEYTSTIKKAFRHAHSYRGGGSYIQRGRYGGHDISLLELDQPIKSTFACLPSPAFQDQGKVYALQGEVYGWRCGSRVVAS